MAKSEQANSEGRTRRCGATHTPDKVATFFLKKYVDNHGK
jgi:hypothetical protein